MSQSNEPREYTGNLRPRIYYQGQTEILFPKTNTLKTFNVFKIEWIEGKDVSKVVFTEEVKVPQGHSFVPQISGYGTHSRQTGFYVDSENRRHFVMDAKAGILGAAAGQIAGRKNN